MDENLLQQILEELREQRRSGTGTGGKSKIDTNLAMTAEQLEKFKKNLSDYTKEITKASSFQQVASKFAAGQRTETINTKDALKDLKDAIEDTVEAERKATASNNRAAANAARAQRAALEEEVARRGAAVGWKNLTTTTGNMAVGLRNITGQMLDAAFDFVSGLQSGKEGAELYAEAAVKAAKSTGEMAKGAGDVVAGLGGLIELLTWFIPGGAIIKGIRIFGALLLGAGTALKEFGPMLSEGAVKAAEAFGKELTNTKSAFFEVNRAGMNLTGGMTELRDRSVEAGYELNTYTKIIKDNSDELSHMGIGVTRSSKLFGELSKGLLESKISGNLYNLGYGLKEQGDLMLFAMSQMSSAGKTEAEIRRDINEATLSYGKSLKILQDITGKDAKQALKKAAEESLDARIMASVRARGGGAEEITKVRAQLALQTPEEKKAFRQVIETGGKAFTEVTGKIADQITGGAFTKKLQEQYSDIFNKRVSSEGYQAKALDIQARFLEATQTQRAQQGLAKLAPAADLGKGNAVAEGVLNLFTGYNIQDTQFKSAKAAKDLADNVDRTAEGMDPLAKSVYTMDNNVRAAGAEFTKLTTGPLKGFSDGLVTSDEYLKGFADKLKELGVKPVPGTGRAGGGGGAGPAPRAGTAASARGGSGTSVFEDFAHAIGIRNTGSQRTSAAMKDMIKFAGGVTGDQAHFDALAPRVKENFIKMIQEYGKSVTVTSAYRSFEEQARVNSGTNPKAQPGHSRHNVGAAIDLDRADVAGLQSAGLLGKYGFQGLASDPVHIQAIETRDKGGSLLAGETAMVGERGPELVQGPGSVTSTATTSKIFNEMNKHLADLVKITKEHKFTSDKMLRASA